MSHRRARVRYDRMTALLVSTGVTIFALLAGVGTFGPLSATAGRDTVSDRDQRLVASVADRDRAATASEAPSASRRLTGTGLTAPAAPTRAADDADGSDTDAPLPAGSGSGKRVVFDMSEQRVWLVDSDNTVERTYLVSGSVTDNLDPGSYDVYSRSRYAVGIDDSGTMQYFVRFTRGDNAAIGFHDIPVNDGRPLQTQGQLGTPQSHGCIRQARPDAIRLWDFAPVGTSVDVVA